MLGYDSVVDIVFFVPSGEVTAVLVSPSSNDNWLKSTASMHNAANLN
jgi:hypothetical protein